MLPKPHGLGLLLVDGKIAVLSLVAAEETGAAYRELAVGELFLRPQVTFSEMERDSSCDRLDKIVSNISNLRTFPLAFRNTVFCLLPSDVSPPTGIYQLMNHLLRLPQRTPAPLRGPLPLKGAQGYCAQRTAVSIYLLPSIVYRLSSIPPTISRSRARTSSSLPRFSSILSAAFR